MVVLATHSHEFLNHPAVNSHHVSRDERNHVVLDPLEAPQRARLDDLGLEPADLLMLHRSIVVVEGSHDQVVLDALIGDELDRLRVLVLPMRGGRLLATVVDSHILAHLSDLPVIAALDNLNSEKVKSFWDDLVANAEKGQAGFDAIVKAHFTNRERDEETFLINYCRAAAELGQTNRFQVFGFAKPDIPEYLPVEVIVPDAESWTALRAEYDQQKKFKSFKPWLKDAWGIEVTEELLREAAAQLDSVPEDFVRLLDLCASSQRRRSSAARS